jgi:hypothetical protein
VREGPLYRVGARERRRSGCELGRRLLMALFQVGEEWGKGKWKGRGGDGVAAPFRVEWRGTGGEPVAGGE